MFCYLITPLSVFVFVALTSKVDSHIGEPCNSLLRMCLPPSNHMYCDENRICRCRPEYPVQVGPHSCLKGRKVKESCSHQDECLFYDKNSYCTQMPYSSFCDCNEGFVYDRVQERCVPRGKKSQKVPLIPPAAAFLVACFSLLCCCLLIWHNLCRKAQFLDRNDQRIAIEMRRDRTNRRENLNRVNNANARCSNVSINLPPYETAFIGHDEPPPSYEDVIKEIRENSSRSQTDEAQESKT